MTRKKSAQEIQPDFERVKQALKLVWEKKCKGAYNLSDRVLDILTETAVKTMWLIEAEHSTNNSEDGK